MTLRPSETAPLPLLASTTASAPTSNWNPRHLMAIAPSIIDTPANRAAMPKADHAAWPKPDQIAATIAFLASSDNQVTTGAIVPVPGPT